MRDDDTPKASRRSILRAGAAIVAAGAVVKHAAAEDTQKIEKSLVGDQDKPNANGQHLAFAVQDRAAEVRGIDLGHVGSLRTGRP